MIFSECLKKSQLYGIENKKTIEIISTNDLIVSIGCETYGIKATYKDILEGKTSRTHKPLDVIWIREENKFLLQDGYHRFLEGVLKGATSFKCLVDWKGYTLLWKIPDRKDRFNIMEDLKKII